MALPRPRPPARARPPAPPPARSNPAHVPGLVSMGQARRGRVRRGDKALPRVRSPPISASAITGQMIHFNLAISPEGAGKLVARRRDWLRNAPRSELGALSRTGRVQPHFCAEVSPEPGLPTTAVPPLAFQIPFFSDSHRSILPLPLKTRHKNHRYEVSKMNVPPHTCF